MECRPKQIIPFVCSTRKIAPKPSSADEFKWISRFLLNAIAYLLPKDIRCGLWKLHEIQRQIEMKFSSMVEILGQDNSFIIIVLDLSPSFFNLFFIIFFSSRFFLHSGWIQFERLQSVILTSFVQVFVRHYFTLSWVFEKEKRKWNIY